MKKSKRKVFLLIVTLCCIIVFSGGLCSMPSCLIPYVACVDYGYDFHYLVEGGNGKIEIEKRSKPNVLCKDASCESNCPENSYYFHCRGAKGGRSVVFTAIPNEGYQVKEWRFNGKIVEGNKMNSFEAIVTRKDNYQGFIVVVFEPIQ